MKKIININLSGRVIPIEDSAYEKLQVYIESLRRYFAKEESRDEIINDIESRIAELMSEKVRKGTSAITDVDVEEIAASMGRPEDFEAEEAEESKSFTSGTQQSYTEPKRKKGRLYRDTGDKFIGGVCSGIAAYLNVDPAIVRILFAIITLGGFGLGFLAYILLWMILPPKDLEGYTGKRLFRNPDEKIIGGVASGVAAYFNKSANTIRLIFAAPILLNILINILDGISHRGDFDIFPNLIFGSLSGTFILAYIILWMVLPEASSPYEKMEMRGEKVDVNTIRQNVKEGVDSMKDRVKGWSEEVKESAQNISDKARTFTNTRGKAFAADVQETARRGGQGLGHAIGVLFRVFFLFIAGSIAFAMFVALLAFAFSGAIWWPINDFLWTSQWQQIYAWGTLIFFFIVPLVAFITWLIRRIIRTRSRNSYLGWIFGSLWVIGWIAAMLLASSLMRDHREQGVVDTPVAIAQPSNGKMVLVVTEPELKYEGRFAWMNDEREGWDLSNDTLRLSTIKFSFTLSPDSLYHVTLKKHAFGRTEEEAMTRASRLNYTIASRDTILDLGNGYTIDKESKFRWQQVEIEIQIPAGKIIRFDQSINEKLNPVDLKVKRDRRDRDIEDFNFNDNYYRSIRPNVDYIMGNDNILRDTMGNRIEEDGYKYRYQNNNNLPPSQEADSVQKLLRDEQRKREESDQKIRDLENRKRELERTNIQEIRKEAVKKEVGFTKNENVVFPVNEWLN